MQFEVEVNPSHNIKESDYSDNTWSDTRLFNHVPPLRIGYVALSYDHALPDEDRIVSATGKLEGWYPLSKVDYFPVATASRAIPHDGSEILRRLNLLYALYEDEKGWPAPNGKPDFLFGWVPHATWGQVSGKGEKPGNVAWATDSPENKVYQVTLAHEIGHNLGRQDLFMENKESLWGLFGWCNRGDPEWPYDDDSDETYDYAIHNIGFDFSANALVSENTDDFMIGQHCGANAYDKKWISTHNFKKLYDALANTAQAANLQRGSSVETIQSSQPVVLVSGYVYTDATARLEVGYQLTAQQIVSQSTGTDYCLSLEGSGAVDLSHSCFDVSFVDPDSGITQSAASFVQVLPYDPAAVRLVLKQGTNELAARLVSAHSPTVTLQTPHGGEVISGTVDVTWTASDADSDPLAYIVSYSADQGQSWHHLGIDITETHLLVDTNVVPGSNQALFRVMASDGINTANAASSVFSVLPHGPRVCHRRS